LDNAHEKTRKEITNITANIAIINSRLTQMDTLSGVMEKLTTLINKSQGPLLFVQRSQQEGDDSSHSMTFHSNPLTHELHLPKVEVNKFDGLDPKG
jgi:hypothetical protein